MSNIIPYQDVKNFFGKIRDQKIIVAGGCFDLLHIGHISLLENAKKHGDILVVLLESDGSIKRKKGINRPIHNQEQRAHLLIALRAVDYVVLLSDAMTNDDYDTILKMINPSLIATTEDDPYIIHKHRQAKELGARVIAVNKYISFVSTTKLLEILSKEM